MNTARTAAEIAALTTAELVHLDRLSWEPAKARRDAATIESHPDFCELPADMLATIKELMLAGADRQEAECRLVAAELTTRRRADRRVIGYVS